MREMYVSEIWSIIRTNQGNAVLLKPRGMEIAVPIFIGTLEMQAILIGREKVKLPRPMTHDLFINMLNTVNLSIKRVEVNELKDDTFHSRIVITGGEYTNEKPLILDSRPSDAIALVTRERCPIYIASTVIEQTGIPLNFFVEALEETARSPAEEENKQRSLREELERAVAEEDYEQAAEIRDMLKLLEEDAS
ncbi:MAG: bifunctional nuclease family protein [Treponema sp.]|jgi:bifunctional DNase/RNase|nr:bifunctional nuclease family protein [Treponema sp.]